MPHDIHGRKIEVGDYVKARPYNYNSGKKVVGVVTVMREGQSCSGDVCWPCIGGTKNDAFGAEEAEIVLKADGSNPEAPPAGV